MDEFKGLDNIVDFVFLNTFCVRGLGKLNIQFNLNGEGARRGSLQ